MKNWRSRCIAIAHKFPDHTNTQPWRCCKHPIGGTSMKMTLSVCWIGVLLAGCGTVPRQEAPPSLFGAATPVGFPSTVRSLAVDRRYYAARAHEAQRRVRAAAAGGTINILALSGGGAGGAFGAGALVGLSRRRERPQFEIVTGVSAGAIIAPFAFLGPAWDAQLIEAY